MTTTLTTRIPITDGDGRVVGEKEIPTYAGVLARAHAAGLKRIRTKLIQIPCADNDDVAIVVAEVEMHDGRSFTGLGDASPRNVSSVIVEATIRMAETRAKARALRDATNIGTAVLEELAAPTAHRDRGPLAGLVRRSVEEVAVRASRFAASDLVVSEAAATTTATAPPAPMTENQRRLILRLLAEQGFEGDAAEAKLRELAGAAASMPISKVQASALIGRLSNRTQSG
jgi:hypothetical protein